MKQLLQWFRDFVISKNKHEHLKRFPIFQDLSRFELNLINNSIHKRSYKVGETIYEAGHPLELVYLIEDGEIKVIGSLKTKTNAILSAGDVIGIIDMFFESTRSSSAIATKDTTMFLLSKTDLECFITLNPKIGNKILKNICCYLSRVIINDNTQNSENEDNNRIDQ